MLKKTVDATILQYLLEFSEQIKRGGDTLLQEHGLTSQQWTILLHLAKDPNLPFFQNRQLNRPILASELALHFNVSRANITNLLNSLTDKKLITQTEDDADRRRRILTLTENGRQLIFAIEALREEANDRLFASFSREEKELFLKFAIRCMSYLESSNIKRTREMEVESPG